VIVFAVVVVVVVIVVVVVAVDGDDDGNIVVGRAMGRICCFHRGPASVYHCLNSLKLRRPSLFVSHC